MRVENRVKDAGMGTFLSLQSLLESNSYPTIYTSSQNLIPIDFLILLIKQILYPNGEFKIWQIIDSIQINLRIRENLSENQHLFHTYIIAHFHLTEICSILNFLAFIGCTIPNNGIESRILLAINESSDKTSCKVVNRDRDLRPRFKTIQNFCCSVEWIRLILKELTNNSFVNLLILNARFFFIYCY